jgi:hypothetical protein
LLPANLKRKSGNPKGENVIRKLLFLLMIVAIVSGMTIVSQAETVKKNPVVINEITHDVSLPLRDMAKMTSVPPRANREIENHPPGVLPKQMGMPKIDPSVDTSDLPAVGTTQLLNFDGQAADGVAPPDTEGSVGLSQYVQWVNLDYNVYDKTTGALILGPVAGNAFWSGFATKACANNNDGDPIVLYDKLASRWFVAQNVFVTPYTMCIAVSNTDDATGAYTRYSFAVTPTDDFPDYPKWGVWPNAYFGSYRDFANGFTFAGGVACALDRNAILAGTAATMQCFPAGTNYDVLLPSDLDGLTPPPDGSTNLYLTVGVDTTHIDAFAFHVDFVNPANSTFTGPTHVQVPAYSTLCQSPFTRSCIPQPTGGEKLDSLGGFLMYRNAYRNFGTYESNLVAHTIAPDSASTAKGAVRWYEVRGGATAPRTFQSGTREDRSTTANSYWLPTMAQDKDADIVMGFSVSGTSTDPSMYYVGRVPTDKHGTMESPKKVVLGTGVQKNTANRWGDYATIAVDPADDCTMWFTSEYIKTTGSFNWSTRITSFKFTGCL